MNTRRNNNMDIKDRSGNLIYSDSSEIFKETVASAWRNKVSLINADFSRHDLSGIVLNSENLEGVNFSNCCLYGTSLERTFLHGADFTGAKIDFASFDHACVQVTKGLNDRPMACPADGEFVAWKKVIGITDDGHWKSTLIKLLVPSGAKRSSATSNKCRCSKAKVLEIKEIYTENNIRSIINNNYNE
jgi:hypothetical protein